MTGKEVAAVLDGRTLYSKWDRVAVAGCNKSKGNLRTPIDCTPDLCNKHTPLQACTILEKMRITIFFFV